MSSTKFYFYYYLFIFIVFVSYLSMWCGQRIGPDYFVVLQDFHLIKNSSNRVSRPQFDHIKKRINKQTNKKDFCVGILITFHSLEIDEQKTRTIRFHVCFL